MFGGHWNFPGVHERPKKIKKKPQSESEDLIQMEKKDTIPLLVSVRCCKQLRCHVAVDVSLFLVRNNKISALLDTKTVYGLPYITASAGQLLVLCQVNLKNSSLTHLFVICCFV